MSRAGDSKYPAYLCAAAGKPFPQTHDAVVFPHFDHARIKELRRMNDGRFMVRLKGVPRKNLSSGSVIIAGGQPVFRSRSGYAIGKRRIASGVYSARGGLFREHLLPGTVSVAAAGSGYRITASADLPLVPGGRYRLTPVEEAEQSQRALPYELVMCIPWELPQTVRRTIGPLLEQIAQEVSLRRISAANLVLLGWTALPSGASSSQVFESAASFNIPDLRVEVEESLELQGDVGTRFLVTRVFFVGASRKMEKVIRQSSGAKVDGIAAGVGLPVELVHALAREIEKAGRLVRAAGVLAPAGERAGLSPIEKGLLESLRERFETSGFVRAGKGADQDILQRLVSLKLAVRIGDRYCASDTFERLVARLLEGRNPGEAIALSEAKRILELPREQLVQFVETLDREGVLRREGPLHRVVKGLGDRK